MVTQIMYAERFSPDSTSLPVFRAMATNGVVTEADIRSLAQYFDQDGPLCLERLPRYVLRDLTIVAGISGSYPARLKRLLLPRGLYQAITRRDIDVELEARRKDDVSLSKVDLSTLTGQEAEHECALRKLRWFGPKDIL